jgi:ABC-type bacteriocin/lantibiotic exporter with double-glycine peptidase domain
MKRVIALVVCAGVGLLAELAPRSASASALTFSALPTTFASVSRQTGPDDCGPAALAFIGLTLGRDLTPTEVARLPGSAPVPWSLLQLQQAADALGLESQLVTLRRVEPTGWHVLHLPLRGRDGHFVAARRVSGDALQVFDPAAGELRVMSEAQLAQRWNGDALRISGDRLPVLRASASGN